MKENTMIPSQASLWKLLKGRKIFLDVSSMLIPAAIPFFYQLAPVLRSLHQKMYMPLEACGDLHYSKDFWSQKYTDPECAALSLIKLLEADRLLEFRSSMDAATGPLPLCLVFEAHRFQHRLLLITQNADLAQDVLALNENDSNRAHQIKVYYLNPQGALVPYHYFKDPYEAFYSESL